LLALSWQSPVRADDAVQELRAPCTGRVLSEKSRKAIATFSLLRGRVKLAKNASSPHRIGDAWEWTCKAAIPSFATARAAFIVKSGKSSGYTNPSIRILQPDPSVKDGGVPFTMGADGVVKQQPFAAKVVIVSTSADADAELPICGTLLPGSKLELRWGGGS